MPPDKRLEFGPKLGVKGDKRRLTYALTASAEGEKLDPLIIGKAQNPACFNKKSGGSLGYTTVTTPRLG